MIKALKVHAAHGPMLPALIPKWIIIEALQNYHLKFIGDISMMNVRWDFVEVKNEENERAWNLNCVHICVHIYQSSRKCSMRAFVAGAFTFADRILNRINENTKFGERKIVLLSK